MGPAARLHLFHVGIGWLRNCYVWVNSTNHWVALGPSCSFGEDGSTCKPMGCHVAPIGSPTGCPWAYQNPVPGRSLKNPFVLRTILKDRPTGLFALAQCGPCWSLFLGTPENAGVTSRFCPLLGPRERRGEVALSDFFPALGAGDPQRTQGLRSVSALFQAPERARVRQPILILYPCLGTPDNAGVAYHFGPLVGP